MSLNYQGYELAPSVVAAIEDINRANNNETLVSTTGASQGYIGVIGPNNFGINASDYPLSLTNSGVTTGPANRTGIIGTPIERAVKPGNVIRVFFSFDAYGAQTGLFVAGTDGTFSPTSGTGVNYVTSAAIAVGATAIPLVTGTGTIVIRDIITFPGDVNEYIVDAGISAPGTITLAAPGLKKAVASGAALTIKPQTRLDDLRFAIDAVHAARCKILVVLDAPATTDTTLLARLRERLFWMLLLLNRVIDIVEPSNELADSVWGYNNPAPMMRIVFRQFQAMSPLTLVLSPSYQGGQTLGNNVVRVMLESSAYSTVTAQNDGGGVGTTGEMFCHDIAYHPYVEGNMTTVRALLTNSNALMALMRSYIEPIKEAMALRRIANPSYWNGRPNKRIWNTEFAFSPYGATYNADFRFQAFTPEEISALLAIYAISSIAAGSYCTLPYAVDLKNNYGPIDVSSGTVTYSTSASSGIRISNNNLVPVCDNDYLTFGGGTAGSSTWCSYASNCSSDGKAFDITVPGGFGLSFGVMYIARNQLGGWGDYWPPVQDMFFSSFAETGWYTTDSLVDAVIPQVRFNKGQLLRQVSGKLTAVNLA